LTGIRALAPDLFEHLGEHLHGMDAETGLFVLMQLDLEIGFKEKCHRARLFEFDPGNVSHHDALLMLSFCVSFEPKKHRRDAEHAEKKGRLRSKGDEAGWSLPQPFS
jgi:hypothetical protein